MVQIRCDNCEKMIQVEDPKPGQKVACPKCGDINIIRDDAAGQAAVGAPSAAALTGIRTVDTGKPAAVDRAAEAGYPSSLGPEVDVMMVRPAMLRAKPLRFILLTIALLGGGAGAVYFSMPANANDVMAIACAAVAALALMWLLVWKAHTLGSGLKITTKRTIERQGFFSKATSDVLHADIKNVQIRQSFLDRVWNVGLIALSSSAENEDEIVIRDVPDPENVRKVIDLYRQL